MEYQDSRSTEIWRESSSWDSKILRKAELLCANCMVPLVDRKIDWRVLPSEAWEEMMDIWHCHKPHNSDEDLTYARNYDAVAYPASSSEGLIADLYLVLKAPLDHICDRLSTEKYRGSSEYVKLWKWCITPRVDGRVISQSALTVINSIFRAAVDTQASYKFIVSSDDETRGEIALWVLAPRVRYMQAERTKDSEDSHIMAQGMKVAFALDCKDTAKITQQNPSIDQITLEGTAFVILRDSLVQSNTSLMNRMKTFMGPWRLAFLSE